MSNKSSKGQAAVEYLMTYGWAILVLVIILMSIVSTGVLSPSYLVSEECNLGPNLPCNFQVFSDGANTKLLMNVTNGFGYTIKLTKFDITLPEENKNFIISSGVPTKIESGSNIIIEAKLTSYTSSINTVKKMKAEASYYSCAPEINKNCDPIIEHKISGRLIGRVLGK